MLLLKKIVGELASPLSIIALLLLAGLALLWFSRRQRTARVVLTAAFVLFVATAYGLLGGAALRALERAHPPLAAVPPDVKWIVVLGGGTSSDRDLPPTSRLRPATLARLVEALRLRRSSPGAKLLLSGGPVFGSGSDAESMAALALALGVPREAIVAEGASADTESQARAVRAIVKDERFVLVTSAAHLPRAVLLFRRAGMKPVPAPAEFLSADEDRMRPGDLFPGIDHLKRADTAIHEYLGIAWARLTTAF